MSGDLELARLLEHPAIWRGRSATRAPVLPSGFAALDACLPGGGWPRTGLIELLTAHRGGGELRLLLPALATLTCKSAARWCTWILPGDAWVPFAPALAAAGVALERVLVVRAKEKAAPWAFEQSLRSGACDAVMAWLPALRGRDTRRLQLAAEQGRALGIVFRAPAAARESSAAALRVLIEPWREGVHLTLLKSRGGLKGPIELTWDDAET